MELGIFAYMIGEQERQQEVTKIISHSYQH